uniref:Uncharacterized protein n=1 Tax=Tanacetum cinerariifolium TaxID=118510 RepID=A0A699GGJ1_TANCI|nr:hypothetical protein [Tanacetum cinerariifolium]
MIFDGMLRNLDNVSGKIILYPRFIQTFLDKQLDGLPTHKEKYDVSFHTKKVFANMKIIGKGFSGKETPLFPTTVGPNQVQMGEGSAQPAYTQHTPTFDMPPPKPKKTQKPRQPKRRLLRFFSLGACIFTDKWSLDELAYGVPTDGPNQTNHHSHDDIISSIRINREGQIRRICHKKEIDVHEYQILTHEIVPTLKPLEEIIQENVFRLGGNRDHVPACLCYMLYYVVHFEKFKLAYYMAKRMEWVTKQKRKDRGMRRGRHSTSSSFAFDQPSSSHLNDDDDDGNGKRTSRASTPSPFVTSIR